MKETNSDMSAFTAKRIIIAASGTGGHLFPALHIANAFRRKFPNIEIEFVGSGRPLEEKIIGGAGYKINVINIVGVKHRGLRGALQSLLMMPKAFIQTWRLFNSFKPQVVVGVGGYVTFVPVTIAFLRGIPSWIHEAEIKPGMANTVLSRYATKVSVAFSQATLVGRSNVIYTGHPVRENLKDITPGLSANEAPRKILVLGGSQGAKGIDLAMQNLASYLAEKKIEVWHQSRPENIEQLRSSYQAHGLKYKVDSFIDDMTSAYSWADIIIARSGAGSVMEISVVNRPTLFVPYPHAQGDHQTANALTLVDVGKALIAKEGEGFETKFQEALERLLEPNFYHAMKNKHYEARSMDAADKIVEGCVDLINKP